MLSATSGAGKARARKAAQAAAANPKSLTELVLEALPVFVRRGQLTIYRSMLRAQVIKLDLIKPPRTFRDNR